VSVALNVDCGLRRRERRRSAEISKAGISAHPLHILGLDPNKVSGMTTFELACPFPTDPVHVFLFTEVVNAAEIRSRLSAGDPAYLFAFIDADLVSTPPPA